MAIGLLTLIGVYRTPESLPAAKRPQGSLGAAFRVYGDHIGNARLVAYAGILGCFAAGIFAYVAGSSFVFIQYYSLPPEIYGLVFAAGIVGIMLANAANRRLVAKVGSDRMMLIGIATGCAAGIFILVQALTGWGGLAGLGTGLFVFVAMNGLVGANAIAGGLSSTRHGAGSASALLGFAQYGGGMIGSALVGTFSNGTPTPMAAVIALGTLSAGGFAMLLRRQTTEATA